MPQIIDLSKIINTDDDLVKSSFAKQYNTKIDNNDETCLKSASSIEKNAEMVKELYPNKILFTIQELAELINTSYEFIRRNIATGKIPAIKCGDRKMINITTVINLVTYGV